MARAFAALSAAIVLASLSGCAFTFTDISAGASATRAFEDGGVFAAGKTGWTLNLSGHWTRDKK